MKVAVSGKRIKQENFPELKDMPETQTERVQCVLSMNEKDSLLSISY